MTKNKNKIWIDSERIGNATWYNVMYRQNRYAMPQMLATYSKSRQRAERFIKSLRSALVSA